MGSYLPNEWGLYDMHGNEEEWCLDWYVDHLGTTLTTDPRGPDAGSYRVLRGGDWNSAASYCRSAFRGSQVPPHTQH
ncbi:MAG: SUMF1/EgtB/PvdO family nonheme iron enzyme [Kiritimatiellia bacterium]